MPQTTIRKYRFKKEINEQLKALNTLDNWHALIALFFDYFVIISAIKLYFINQYFYPITILIIGSRQGALANLAHDAGHGRLTKNKKLNYFIGTFLTGYFIFQEMKTFIDSHVKSHHIYLGDAKIDPDYSYHISVGLYATQSRYIFIHKYVIKPLYLGSIFHYMRNLFLNRAPIFLKHKKEALIMIVYWGFIIALILFFGWLKCFLLFWIIPFLTVFPTIGWFIDLVEHYPLVGKNKIDIYMTRNRFSHPIENYIFNIHNENFHLVHHLRPDIPFWNLKKAHNVLLKDKEYLRLHNNVGGIFLSNNRNFVSFIRLITQDQRKIFRYKI